MTEKSNVEGSQTTLIGHKSPECTKSGCRNFETICKDCRRVICTKTFQAANEWIFPIDDEASTWWPRDKRVLACDANGWVNILKMTEHGFELDDGGEAGDMPIAWMNLPEPPK